MALHFDTSTRAVLTSVNPRSENHGDELVPGLDLRFSVDAPAAVLGCYHPDLAAYLYDDKSGQLRFGKMAQPLKWDDEAVRCKLAIDYGINGEENPEVMECRVHRHALTLKPGGTVTVEFTCTATQDLNEHLVGRLGMLVKHALFVTLTAGEPPPVDDDKPKRDDRQGTLSLVQQ